MKPAVPAPVCIHLNGKPVAVAAGSSVAAALAAHGDCTRTSVSGTPRQAFCGMGVCQECRVQVDGLSQQTGCMVQVQPGMRIHDARDPAATTPGVPRTADGPDQPRTEDDLCTPAAGADRLQDADSNSTEVLVVGAGPGGLAAALAAAQAGAQVLLLDAAAGPGGQIWRAHGGTAHAQAQRRQRQLQQLGVRQHYGLRVVAALPGRLLCEDSTGLARLITFQRLVLACGARELIMPFPGWTLPGVFGAGGLQALVKSGWPIAGQRVVVAGSGPLLLAAAHTIRRAGGRIVALLEAAPAQHLLRFGLGLLNDPARLWQALCLRAAQWNLRWRRGRRIQAALGTQHLQAVVLDDGLQLDCDALAVGDGLLPNLELPRALGCELQLMHGQQVVWTDARQQTSQPGIYAVGELTGIAGARRAQLQGRSAGLAASARPVSGQNWRLRRENAFAARLARCFARPRIDEPAPQTLICRCEDVCWSQLRDQPDWRSAKLHTRVGMGACQGRVCAPILALLKRWPLPASAQPLSLSPMRMHTLLALQDTDMAPASTLATHPASTQEHPAS